MLYPQILHLPKSRTHNHLVNSPGLCCILRFFTFLKDRQQSPCGHPKISLTQRQLRATHTQMYPYSRLTYSSYEYYIWNWYQLSPCLVGGWHTFVSNNPRGFLGGCGVGWRDFSFFTIIKNAADKYIFISSIAKNTNFLFLKITGTLKTIFNIFEYLLPTFCTQQKIQN